MKILIINCTYYTGSTGKIIADCEDYYINRGHEVVVAYGGAINKSEAFKKKNVHQICYKIEGSLHVRLVKLGLVMLYGGLFFSFLKIRKILLKESPDIVHVHCLNGCTTNIFRLLSFLGGLNIPTIITHHSETYYTGSCSHAVKCLGFAQRECVGCPNLKVATGTDRKDYAHESWQRMKKAFATFSKNGLMFTAVSPWVKSRSLMSPIVNEFHCEVVKNGIDTNIFKYTSDKTMLSNLVDKVQGKRVLHVTSSFRPNQEGDVKGGKYIVELAKRHPEVTFIIVSTNAVQSEDYPSNMLFYGRVNEKKELAELYSIADLTVIASTRETFSMIVAESLCCGTPVVGFEAGGPESIALETYSHFVPYGDIDSLSNTLKTVLLESYDKSQISRVAKLEYDSKTMAQHYLNIYERLLKNNKRL